MHCTSRNCSPGPIWRPAEEGADPGFDPLAIMVEQAHQRGLQLHAWVNPYRVRTSATNKQLSSKNPAVKLLKSGDAIRYNGAVTYDPASKKAQQLIVEGVREIVEKYDVDGIHFDDYFYPTTRLRALTVPPIRRTKTKAAAYRWQPGVVRMSTTWSNRCMQLSSRRTVRCCLASVRRVIWTITTTSSLST